MAVLHMNDRPRQAPTMLAYRRALAATFSTHRLLQHLPALADLPLELTDTDGTPCKLDACLRDHTHVTIAGPTGSGRRLALMQCAVRMATSVSQLPMLVDLTLVDDGVSAPDRILNLQIASLNPPPTAQPPRLAFWRPQTAESLPSERPSIALIFGLDELPEDRQYVWRIALQRRTVPESLSKLIVSVSATEPAWAGYYPLHVAPVTPAILTSWVEHLAPPQHCAALDSALAPFHALNPLSTRLFEIALLAWVTPRLGMPASRAELYAMALSLAVGITAADLSDSPPIASLQLLAAYDEPPTVQPAATLVAKDNIGRYRFYHPQIRRYLAARQLAAEQRLDLIDLVSPDEQRELALLLATMLDDPSPLYEQLWNRALSEPPYMLLLGRCLRERAPANSAWTLRVIAGLAQLVGNAADPTREQATALLHDNGGALEAAINTALTTEASAPTFLMRLFNLLPPALANTQMLNLVLSNTAPHDFGWDLVEHLLGKAELRLPISTPIGANEAVLARWIALHALHTAEQRPMLDAVLARGGLMALERVGEPVRILRIATPFIEDQRLAAALRITAINVLSSTGLPIAVGTLERAAEASDPQIRQAALSALGSLGPERAVIAWGRTAVDRSASWELRLAAIEALGDSPSNGVAHQLAQCAADPRLPLIARKRAIEQLEKHQPGHVELHLLLNRKDIAEVIRAAVARSLGAAGYQPALRDLVRLLELPPAAHLLIESCCIGLGRLRNLEATAPLLALLERSFHDTQLSLAAIRALGELGDVQASDTLSQLLGTGATERLHRSLTPRLLQLPAENCLDNSAIPPRMIEQLASSMAHALTPDARPSSLGEFLDGEADRVRLAAAQALIAIGGNTARAALLATLLDDTAGGATADLIAALADLDGPDSTDMLGYLLEATELSSLTRWLVVQHLAAHPGGEALMARALMNPALDTFTRGALAEGLGQRHVFSALPVLRQLADDPAGDTHLRRQAILGLGLLNDPTTETILLRIASDPQEDITLRGMAADYLPSTLSAEGCRTMRDLLRGERQPTPLLAGALRTLGRAHDHEALSLMLQYFDDPNTSVAQAAIDALADIGDASVSPKLVQLSQQPNTDHALRLQAVGALLKLGGSQYRPLLHTYLQQGALPFRLLALEALLDADTPPDELRTLLVERSWPTALRLRLLEYLAGDIAAAPMLHELLQSDDEAQLRALAAESLGKLRWQEAAPTLSTLAQDTNAELVIRLRCIAALCRIDTLAGWVAIGQLAYDERQPSVIRDTALHMLYQ